MKKILVTGSNGLLGQKLVYNILSRNDLQLIATSSGQNRLAKTEGYIYESLDITSEMQVQTIIEKYKPDVIINTAAMTNVDSCEVQRELCWNINVNGVSNIIRAIKKSDIHFIHLSTDFIFDGKKGSEYEEEDEPNPQSYYAMSKFASEKLLYESDVKWSIARTIIVYGIVDNMSRSNIVLWAKDALGKGQEIKVVSDQFRSPTLAEDLADGCLRIMDREAQGIFHLSGPETYSILELVYKIADFWKLDRSLITAVRTEDRKQAAPRPLYTGFIIDKARQILGYSPHTFTEGLKILDRQIRKGT